MAGTLESFCSKQRVKQSPSGFPCNLEQLINVPKQLIICPQSSLIGQDSFPGLGVSRLLSQGMDQGDVRDGRFRDQTQSGSIQ